MTVEEFEEKRARQWHLRPEFALTTERELLKFIQDVGAASLSLGKNALFPSLVRAIDGSVRRWYPRLYRNSPYAELMEKFWKRYVESRQIFEVNLVQDTPGVVSRKWMIALFAILGESHLGRRRRSYSVQPRFTKLELAAFKVILEKGPISQKHLTLALNLWNKSSRRQLGTGLQKLWKALKILRVGYTRQDGGLWDIPIRWDPPLRESASTVPREKAVAELIKKYITMAVATSRKRISRAFAGILTPTQISEALRYLLLKKSVVIDTNLILDGKRALTAGPNR
ncbi:MAG: crosslink repair DNA glycosylase YcaQ family protein [Bacteroidota bacterium]